MEARHSPSERAGTRETDRRTPPGGGGGGGGGELLEKGFGRPPSLNIPTKAGVENVAVQDGLELQLEIANPGDGRRGRRGGGEAPGILPSARHAGSVSTGSQTSVAAFSLMREELGSVPRSRRRWAIGSGRRWGRN